MGRHQGRRARRGGPVAREHARWHADRRCRRCSGRIDLATRAATVGFDWPTPDDVLDKIEEEIGELRETRASGETAAVAEEARRPAVRGRQPGAQARASIPKRRCAPRTGSSEPASPPCRPAWLTRRQTLEDSDAGGDGSGLAGSEARRINVMSTITRRTFFERSTSGLLVAAASARVNAAPAARVDSVHLGVASGDPLADRRRHLDAARARAARNRRRHAARGDVRALGGRRTTKPSSRSSGRGAPMRRRKLAHAVHVDVAGLEPARALLVSVSRSARGRARSDARARPPQRPRADELRLAFASCQRWEQGYFTALRHLAHEDVDLVFHLGDYIYEYGDDREGRAPVTGPEIITLDDYRRATRSIAPTPPCKPRTPRRRSSSRGTTTRWTTTTPAIDPKTQQTREAFLRRRAAAYRAYFEHMAAAAGADPARTRPAALSRASLRPPCGVPGARHAAVPHRAAVRRGSSAALRCRARPRRHDPRRRAGTVAARCA